MSEPELAYMTGSNDDFDLPRWQNHHFHDPLSSSAQAAQAAQQAAYTGSSYTAASHPPPPQSSVTPARPPQLINVNTSQSVLSDSKPSRMSHLFDGDQPLGHSQPQYLSSLTQSSLSRSASLGGAVASAGHAGIGSGAFGTRRTRHHMPDDLESAFTNESPSAERTQQHRMQSSSQQISQSFYPPSVPFHQAHQPQINATVGNTASSVSTDPYQDSQYSSTSMNQPRRSNTRIDDSISSRSPRRGIHDQFAQHTAQTSNQYSPTSAVYQYSNPSDMLSSTSYTYQSAGVPQTHTVKTEPATSPLASPYAGQRALPPPPAPSNTLYSQAYPMDTTSPGPSSQNSPMHLTSHPQNMLPLRQSLSTPSTPLSYHPSQTPQHGQVVYQPSGDDPSAMSMEVGHKRRASGFKRVRDQRDLRPHVNVQPAGRRGDTNGQFLSPLRQLTTHITDTYHICNPHFRYESSHNPRRVLTKPSKAMHNEGFDNEDYDYILYVNDWLGSDSNKYLILDVLGQGTFGQVVKCQNMKTHEIVAVKVVKNKPAYFNQSMMEVTILELLNNQCDPHDEHHILRLRDSFIHKQHLCLVFELLSSNLYELIKQNQFQGLSTQLVKVFTAQLLDALTVLKEARLIHCDLKPENILLKSLQSPTIKVIDFGSACHERQTVYTYIQSRFYRSPEVLLGLPYNTSIDMWSLGCIAVELFLGLPLFPGTSEYNQITRIVEMLGMPPTYMLESGKQSAHFFDQHIDHYGLKKYKLKSIEQYSRERNTNEQPGKQYFKATSLPDIINNAPMPNFKSSSKSGHEMEKELMNRAAFIDFCQGLLNLDPHQRWSPQQAKLHPFITGDKFTKPFVPTSVLLSSQPPTPATTDPKRPYGGLVPSQPKGQRAYQDAASYNMQLAQHQATTAQAHAASQVSNQYRNPYGVPQQPQQNAPPANSLRQDQQYTNTLPQGIPHSHSMSSALNVPSSLQPNPPSSTYYPNSRHRSNTMGNSVDAIPPALARLRHMNNDVITGRNALTPVLNREDPIREWERRQSGQPPAQHSYPQLELLQQQAELAASGLGPWTHSRRYQAQPSSLSQSYQPPPPSAIVVDEPERRDAALATARTAARADQSSTSIYASGSAAISSPPQAYPGGSVPATNRYAPSYITQAQSNSFDSLERRGDMASLYAPIQPDQYQSYGQSAVASSPSHAQQHHDVSLRGVTQASSVPQSFYNSSITTSSAPPASAQRNPFQAPPPPGSVSTVGQRDGQRVNGMDIWPR